MPYRYAILCRTILILEVKPIFVSLTSATFTDLKLLFGCAWFKSTLIAL